jgi:hypothetical protein
VANLEGIKKELEMKNASYVNAEIDMIKSNLSAEKARLQEISSSGDNSSDYNLLPLDANRIFNNRNKPAQPSSASSIRKYIRIVPVYTPQNSSESSHRNGNNSLLSKNYTFRVFFLPRSIPTFEIEIRE